MTGDRIHFRLRDDLDRIILEQVAGPDNVDAAGTHAQDVAAAHVLATGRTVYLECMDPDGDLWPAGEWQTVGTASPAPR